MVFDYAENFQWSSDLLKRWSDFPRDEQATSKNTSFWKYVTSPVFKKGTSWLHPRLFFWGGGPWFSKVYCIHKFYRCPLDWFERISTTDLFLGFNAQLNQVYRRGFFPYILYTVFFPKKKRNPGFCFESHFSANHRAGQQILDYRLIFADLLRRLSQETFVCEPLAVLLMKHICLHISSILPSVCSDYPPCLWRRSSVPWNSAGSCELQWSDMHSLDFQSFSASVYRFKFLQNVWTV